MTITVITVKDANSANQTLLTTTDGANQAGVTVIGDGVAPSTNRVTVAQFHNADNQALGSSAYGIQTGGVAQLLNQTGNLDRQREAGVDNIPSQGIVASATNLAMNFSTTSASNITGSATPQAITILTASGTNGGVPWSIQKGSVLLVDTVASAVQEYVTVTGISGTSVTAAYLNNHNGSVTAFPVVGFTFNQARDAAGESDGATGAGTAVAAEYRYNAGAPGPANFDRARTVQGKGRTIGTISSGGGTASKSMVLSAITGLQSGMAITLFKTASYPAGNPETAYVASNWNGSTTVLINTGIVNGTQDRAAWDSFAILGADVNGFSGTGIGVEASSNYDPVGGLFYLQRAPTADSMATTTVRVAGNGLFNEVGYDRQRGNCAYTVMSSAARTTSQTVAMTNYNAKGFYVIVDVTAVASSTITPSLTATDPVSGKAFQLHANFTAVTATGTYAYLIAPSSTSAVGGITAVANVPVPRNWNVVITAGNTASTSYSVGAFALIA